MKKIIYATYLTTPFSWTLSSLTVPVQSSTVKSERDFIEAASIICSYSIRGPSGAPLSPLEIRLAKDRLDLIGNILTTSMDAYKRPGMLLDLADKLGFRDDIHVPIKILAMAAEVAMQNEDFSRSADIVDDMVERMRVLRESPPDQSASRSLSDAEILQACWQTCFQLARQTEYTDTARRLLLFGHALNFCPPDHVLAILADWRNVRASQTVVRRRGKDASRETNSLSGMSATSVAAHLRDFRSGIGSQFGSSEAAAIASRTLNRVTATLPFGTRKPTERESAMEHELSPGVDVSSQARHAFSKGIGWLIGAGEHPMGDT